MTGYGHAPFRSPSLTRHGRKAVETSEFQCPCEHLHIVWVSWLNWSLQCMTTSKCPRAVENTCRLIQIFSISSQPCDDPAPVERVYRAFVRPGQRCCFLFPKSQDAKARTIFTNFIYYSVVYGTMAHQCWGRVYDTPTKNSRRIRLCLSSRSTTINLTSPQRRTPHPRPSTSPLSGARRYTTKVTKK